MAVPRNEKAKRSAILVFIVIILLAVILAFLSYRFLRTMRTNIYVFNSDYSAGEFVSAEMFEPMEIDSRLYNKMESVADGCGYSTSEEINAMIRNGDRLRVDVIQNLPATNNLFASSANGSVEAHLSDNLVSVELNTLLVEGISGSEVYPGSKLNLLQTYVEDGKSVTEVLVQNVNVVGSEKDEWGNARCVYIEVAPDLSLKIVNALNTKKVTANIVKAGAYLELNDKEMSYSEKVKEPETVAPMAAAAPVENTSIVEEATDEQ